MSGFTTRSRAVPPAHRHQPQELEGPMGAQGPWCSCSQWRVKACRPSSPGTAHTRPGRTLPWGWTGTCSSCRPHRSLGRGDRVTQREKQAARTEPPSGSARGGGSLGREPTVLGGRAASTQLVQQWENPLRSLVPRPNDLPYQLPRNPQTAGSCVNPKRDIQDPQERGRDTTEAGVALITPGATLPRKDHLPMTAFGSVPKAQMHGEPEGTWNLEKLHLELKYFGRKLADAKLWGQGRKERKLWSHDKLKRHSSPYCRLSLNDLNSIFAFNYYFSHKNKLLQMALLETQKPSPPDRA